MLGDLAKLLTTWLGSTWLGSMRRRKVFFFSFLFLLNQTKCTNQNGACHLLIERRGVFAFTIIPTPIKSMLGDLAKLLTTWLGSTWLGSMRQRKVVFFFFLFLLNQTKCTNHLSRKWGMSFINRKKRGFHFLQLSPPPSIQCWGTWQSFWQHDSDQHDSDQCVGGKLFFFSFYSFLIRQSVPTKMGHVIY